MNVHVTLCAAMLVGAALFSTVPAEARSGLLPEGSHPPAFTLPDQAGKSVSLHAFLSSRRIVLLFNPTQALLDTIQTEHTQFADRDLTTLAVVPPGSPLTATAAGIHLLTDADGKVARHYGASDGKPAFYLIGKDGHIAVARQTVPTPHTLYGIIDAMPMRRQEMRERGR